MLCVSFLRGGGSAARCDSACARVHVSVVALLLRVECFMEQRRDMLACVVLGESFFSYFFFLPINRFNQKLKNRQNLLA